MVLIRLIDGLNEIVGRIVAFVAVIFAGMIIYDVALRYGFNSPTLWAFDLTKQLYGFYFVLLGGYALRHQSHVRVDLVTETLRPGVRRGVEILGYLIFFFPFAWSSQRGAGTSRCALSRRTKPLTARFSFRSIR